MYYVVYGLLWLISLLPLRVLYFLGDGIYGIVFYLAKYRRPIVDNNLLIAFPEKTEKERYLISKRFYHNLVDTFIEMLKMISASNNYIQKRFKGNWEVINDIKPSGRKLQLHLGHNFNWEWANAAAAKKLNYPYIGAYMPVKNKVFNRMFYNLRSKFGTLLVSATNMREDMLKHRNTQYMLALVADQNPGHPASGLWFNFFSKPAPFLSKPAKSAIANECALVFAFIHKTSRGHYEVVFEKIADNAADHSDIELTRRFVRYMEDVIRTYPDMWLWSHRRWKHEWKGEYGKIIE